MLWEGGLEFFLRLLEDYCDIVGIFLKEPWKILGIFWGDVFSLFSIAFPYFSVFVHVFSLVFIIFFLSRKNADRFTWQARFGRDVWKVRVGMLVLHTKPFFVVSRIYRG